MKLIDPNRLTAVLRRHQGDASACRVLVVDDDPDLRRRLRGFLDGCAVDEAADGREALDRLAARPSLVLLDLLMPVVDGFEFLAEFRQRDEYRSVPAIVPTAKDQSVAEHDRLHESVERSGRSGRWGPQQLLAEIRAAMADACRAR